MGGSFDASGPYEVAVRDHEYARPGGEPLLARVYRPVADGARFPLLVDVHGGAWSAYDRTADAVYDRALAACGLVVVALDFRQAPAHRWPAAASDVVAGIRWAKAGASPLGAVPERTGIVGGSSGGHLAMVAALRPGGADLGITVPLSLDGAELRDAGALDARVEYALALWPILDPPARYRYVLARRDEPVSPARDRFFSPERLIAGHRAFFGDQATMQHASAQRMVDEGDFERLPSLWLAHPELDENVTLPMSERFVASYRRAGGEAELEVFPGVGHAFANFPGEPAERCIASMRRFVARRLAAGTKGTTPAL